MEKKDKRNSAYYEKLDAETRALADKNRHAYISKGAMRFLENVQGYQDMLKVVKSGCEQILEGKGLSPEDPLIGIGISGFYQLFRELNYTHLKQKAHSVKKGDKKVFLDEMTMQHVKDKSIVVYYNLVE